MHRKGSIAAIAAASFAFLVAGCDEMMTGVDCTLIACGDAIRVELADLPEPFTITFRAEGEEPLTFESSDPELEDDVVFIPDVEPDRLTVEVEAEGVDFTQTFDLEYETFRPNGPDCPPVCRMATVVVDLP